MKKTSFWLYATTTVLLLQATGHTLGGVLFYRAHTPEEAAVITAMQSSRVAVAGATRSLWDFYYGWGLAVGALTYVLAGIAWATGRLASRSTAGLDVLMGLIIAGCLAQTLLCLKYFFALPVGLTLSAGLLCCVGWAQYHRQPAGN